jgi:hypothetical protein
MKTLTKEEVSVLVSDETADYEKEISLFVPLTGDEPVIMYTSISRGQPSMHYLSVSTKRKYAGGLYVYSPKKPFDISEHEFSDTVGFVELANGELTLNCTGLNYIELYKDDAIVIAKVLGVTGEDLL